MSPSRRPGRARVWSIAALALFAVTAVSVALALSARWSRTLELATPAETDLAASYGEPNDPEEVPTFREAMAYIQLCRRRPLSPAELDRVIDLAARARHPATVTTAFGVLNSVAPGDRRPNVVAAAVAAARNADPYVRAVGLSTLGNLGAKEHADVVTPFLDSKHAVERSAARTSLAKLGYKLPVAAQKDAP